MSVPWRTAARAWPERSVTLVIPLMLPVVVLLCWTTTDTGKLWTVLPAPVASNTSKQVSPRTLEIVVAHRGVSWWVTGRPPHWKVPCSWQGQPLTCEYVSTSHAAGNATAQALLRQAQVLVNEDCWDPAGVPAEYKNMTQVMFSMEPYTNLQCFDKQVADAEMTYRRCSQVWSPYWAYAVSTFWHPDVQVYSMASLLSAPLALSEKLNAIAYINSNCVAASGRQDIMRQLQALLKQDNSSLTVHSFGKCDPNMDAAVLADFRASKDPNAKIATFRKYKFCVTMENSITRDYVSEKVYDGLVAGCVPIYLGASNVAEYVPDDNAIIDYHKLGSPQALKAELERLATDEQAYTAKLAWKAKDTQHWNQGFQHLLAYSEQHPMCHLCRFVVEANMKRQHNGYTLCSANSSWAHT